MKLFKAFEVKKVFFYAFYFLSLFIVNAMGENRYPLSNSLFLGFIYNGSSPLLLSLFYLINLFFVNRSLLLSGALFCLFLSVIFEIYKLNKTAPKGETVIYSLISFCPYFLIDGDGLSVESKIYSTLFICLLGVFFAIFIGAIKEKGLKKKFSFIETAVSVMIVLSYTIGLSNLFSPLIVKGISVFIILSVAFIYKQGTEIFISVVLGIGYSLYFSNLFFVSVFLIWAIIVSALNKVSRYLSAVGVVAFDFLIQAVFKIYPTYGLEEFLPVLIGATAFTLLPTKLLLSVKDKLYLFREKQLTRITINNNRVYLSNKIYSLANVFRDMGNAWTLFQKNQITEEGVKNTALKEIERICKNCPNLINCKKTDTPLPSDLNKTFSIGIAKGKLSIIDLPKNLVDGCLKINEILFSMNKTLSEYKNYLTESESFKTGRLLIASQSLGVSDVLRNFALEIGQTLNYQTKLERELGKLLLGNGISATEILLYGDYPKFSVGMVISMPEYSIDQISYLIKGLLKTNMALVEKFDLSENKTYLLFKSSSPFDAIFGITKKTKDGSINSGDTYAVQKINEDKFLLAISDGMGSGDIANKLSSASVSLIESFYKAGLSGNTVLNTVNKLLAVNTEDCFTALDLSVINLEDCSADFIKYGSPYSFIIGKDSIKIVEGNTLPLGILEELRPSVCHTELATDDMVLFMSDGVSDAFSSSSEIIDFLKTVPALNPQTLTDNVVKKALSLYGGKEKDDMTALAVRVIERIN